MTKRLAIMASVLSAIVFLTTLARPNTLSEWPPIVQAASGAAGVFVMIWFFLPLVAYLAHLVLTPFRKALRRSGAPDA
jgi:antibiotic biosynthesis monooxygenase (ABM) superfamily enzyme